ncbi:hypothetical protein ACHAWT_009858 [Skeletonema menzelii]
MAASSRGSSSGRSLISLTTLSRVLVICIFLASLQSFVLLSKISSESGQKNSEAVVDNDANNNNNNNNNMPTRTLFTPEEFRAGRIENYINLPTVYNPDRDKIVQELMERPVPEPTETLLHKAPTPPSGNVILGLASYPTFKDGWLKLVGSLRTNGYEGHIIVGVHPEILQDERDYLDKMGVTYYAVETVNCSATILNGVSQTENRVRAKCSRGLENLKLEWGRFEMARRWLRACDTCTGWSMVIDTRDIFFQKDPFASLGDADDAQQDLMFVEEVAQYTNTLPDKIRAINIGASGRYKHHTIPCYGSDLVTAEKIIDRPMLCSGTVIGSKNGTHRFLSVLVDEFHNNNHKRAIQCKSPHTTDQWTMNYLYYRGDFGFPQQTKTLPWGTGPVLTVGKPCASQIFNETTKKLEHVHSLKDMMVFDANDLILNPHEKKGSPTYVAPTLHQWDRCYKWINPWFNKHKKLFSRDDEVKWVKES